jgi:protein-S-isoprenylcysteine O-methyltransferase Ste14
MNLIDILVIISLAVFYLLFIGRTVLLYKKGIKVFVIGTSTKKLFDAILENILMPVLLIWSILVVITALQVDLPIIISKLWIESVWVKYIGILFCYMGLILFLWALISFGQAWRIGIDENNADELITKEIFRYSRNPVFLFMDLYFMGIMLVYPNIVFIIIAIGAIIGIHLQILREEKFLLKKFGEKYIEYQNQTRRYI